MAEFTIEEQEQIRLADEKSDLRQFLKGCYTKIQDGLRKLDERSVERAVWELVQNARDLSDHAVICIRLKKDSIEFEHHGLPFDFDSLSSLVKQVSSQDKEKGDKVGQYGTGFMTTHKFSKKVYIHGDYKVSIGDKTLYADLLDYRDASNPKEFCLDRSEIDVECLTDEMFVEIQNIKKLRYHADKEAPDGITIFRYNLTEDKRVAYYPQIRQSLKLLPYVLAFNDKIEEIGFYDEELDERVVYRRKSILPGSVYPVSDSKTIVCIIERELNGGIDEIRLQILESSDESNRIILPPLPVGYDDISTIPSQFIFFPLLKTEIWGINFIYHSSKLWPTEPRDCYQLPYDNEDVQERADHNKSVIQSMDEMLFDYYRTMVVAQQSISIDFAKVNFKAPDKADSKTIAYIDELQRRWVAQMTNWTVIPTKNGMRKITDADVAVLSPELFERLSEEQIEQYLPVMSSFAEKVKTIPNRDIQEWTNRVNEWASDESGYYVTVLDICKSIKGVDGELHAFLTLLGALGKAEIMKQYDLIPNRKSTLCNAGVLRSGLQITADLYALAAPLLGPKLDLLVDSAYEDVYKLTPYTRENLRDDVTALITNWRSSKLAQNVYLKSEPDSEEQDDSQLLALLNYCNAYRTQEPDSKRSRLLQLLSKMYDIELHPTYIPRHAEEDDILDLYNTAYMYLWEDTLLWLSNRDTAWLTVEENKSLLIQLIALFSQMGERFRTDANAKYAIYPSRSNKMWLLDDLYACDVDDTELYELYKMVMGAELNDKWVWKELEPYAEFKSQIIKDIGDKIDEKLQEDDYKHKAVLTIIRHLDNGEWLDCFPNINLQKRELQYNQCDDSVRESIYRLQMKDDDKGSLLARMADLAENEDVLDILNQAELQVAEKDEQERQKRFKYAIGKAIEDAVRAQLKGDLHFDPKDVQNGQDMIIYKNGEPVFFLEVKSKWNFNQPAYMSHNQVLQAVRKKDHYALLCVDCRPDDSQLQYGGGCGIAPDASDDDIQKLLPSILQHTWVHQNIGTTLEPMLKGIITALDGDDESTIKVDGDFCGRIPLKVFVKGDSYAEFILRLSLFLNSL